MKLTIQEASRLYAGLNLLDGYDVIAKDGERERVVKKYYSLGAGLRLSIAMNIDRLESVLGAYRKARNALVLAKADGKSSVPETRLVEFSAEDAALLEAEQDIDLNKIKSDELRLDENPIPVTTLAMIQALLRD